MSSIHMPHDSLFKYVFSNVQHAREELMTVLPAELTAQMELTALRECAVSLLGPSLAQSFTDLLFSVPLGGKDGLVYILIEHQSQNDRWMAVRLWNYVGKIWDWFVEHNPKARELPLIIPVVVHHSRGTWTAVATIDELVKATDTARTLLADKLPRLGYFVDDLSAEQDEELQARTMAALPRLALWTLKHARHTTDFIAKMREIGDLFMDVTQSANGVRAMGALLRYIHQVSDVKEYDLEQFTLELGKPAYEAFMTVEQQIQQRTQRSIFQRLLLKRFGDIPQEVAQRVEQAQSDQLWQWLERLVVVDTLDDVFADAATAAGTP